MRVIYSFQLPISEQEWKNINQGFSARWNFPNCAEALDGKHVILRRSFHSGSDPCNYKRTFSIILLALTDYQYCFEYIDVGANGRASDGGAFEECNRG
nr:unnamed protein product [Callosobruchus analis]CAI5861199.1 unnamed protein product [Callosobruchus analis]